MHEETTVHVVAPPSLLADALTHALTHCGLLALRVTAAEVDPAVGSGCEVFLVDALESTTAVRADVETIRAARPGAAVVLLVDEVDTSTQRLADSVGAQGWVTTRGSLADVIEQLSNPDSPRRRDRLPDREAPATSLTARELEILSVVASGLSDSATAERLDISVHTVRAHLESARTKLGVANRFAAVSRVRQAGQLNTGG